MPAAVREKRKLRVIRLDVRAELRQRRAVRLHEGLLLSSHGSVGAPAQCHERLRMDLWAESSRRAEHHDGDT